MKITGQDAISIDENILECCRHQFISYDKKAGKNRIHYPFVILKLLEKKLIHKPMKD